MQPSVANKGVIACKSTTTYDTNKRLRARMGARMARQMLCLGKAVLASTVATTETLGAWIQPSVATELILRYNSDRVDDTCALRLLVLCHL